MIGRVGWDSFVTQWALDSGIEVIDASQFLHAAHLTGADGNNAVRASNYLRDVRFTFARGLR